MEYIDVLRTRIAFERRGKGPPLVFVHGWPFHSATWRRVVPLLEDRYTCITFDLPGLGRSESEDTYGLRELAALIRTFVNQIGLHRYGLVAQDMGGSVARLVAEKEKDRITEIVVINSEIPFHRPPFVEAYARLLKIPGALSVLRRCLDTDVFTRSRFGYGGCFFDRSLIDREFESLFIRPLVESKRRAEGAVRYLETVDWSVFDELDQIHEGITAPMHFIWGQDDPTFPIELARDMAARAPTCTGFTAIPNAQLLVHEERPREVADAIRLFVSAGDLPHETTTAA